jgi:hypothetical protein
MERIFSLKAELKLYLLGHEVEIYKLKASCFEQSRKMVLLR